MNFSISFMDKLFDTIYMVDTIWSDVYLHQNNPSYVTGSRIVEITPYKFNFLKKDTYTDIENQIKLL